MLKRNPQYYEWLLPYLEGGLDEARRAQLEARLGEDPALAAEAERLRRTLGSLRGAAARTPRPENAQAPADLWPHLRARLVLHPAPRARASRAWWLAGVGAPAAAALIVAAFWLPGWHTPDMPLHSIPPPVRRPEAPAAPTPSALPTHPASVTPIAALKPPSAAKSKRVVPKPPLPAPVVMRPTPFDLPAPAPPVNHSVNSSRTPPVVPVPSGGRAAGASSPPPSVASIAPSRHQDGVGTVHAVAPSVMPPSAPQPASVPKPVPPPTPPAPATATDRGGPPPPSAPNKAVATAGMSGGAAGPGSAAAPKETVNGLGSAARQQAKPQPDAAPNLPPAALFGHAGQPPHDARHSKMPLRLHAPRAPGNALQALDMDAQAGLDVWQAALSAAVRLPLWGENGGEQQANQALMAAREAGLLDDLRARLEARRAQSPRDLATGRMLAAVYDFGFSTEAALRERRRTVGMEGAGGEDWYALAQAEGRAGNGSAARAAYRRALEAPIPPSSFHAAIARQRS